ncbi:MAG: hypothetical protein P8Y70_21155 [Candidatus Lokiarchaeota archaeon]
MPVKIPINKSTIKGFLTYSNTIMQFKQGEPYIFDHSRIMCFDDIDKVKMDKIDTKIKDLYHISELSQLEGFENYKFLFETPIIRKSRSCFEKEYYQYKFLNTERFKSIFLV